MALGSTQPLTEMSTGSISCAIVTKSGSLNFLEPSGAVQACNWTALPYFGHVYIPHLAHLSTAGHILHFPPPSLVQMLQAVYCVCVCVGSLLILLRPFT